MKSYILVFNENFADRSDVTEFVDGIPEIINWRTDMPHCVFLVSELSARQISDRLSELNNTGRETKKGFYIVNEITPNKQGWLPKKAWQMINEKHEPRD